MKVVQFAAFICALLALQTTFADATDPNYDFGQIKFAGDVFEKEIKATADNNNDADLFAFNLSSEMGGNDHIASNKAESLKAPSINAKFDQHVKSVALLDSSQNVIRADFKRIDAISLSNLERGQYYLKVVVDNQHQNAQPYKVNLTTRESDVPEPSTNYMMMAWLCLIVYTASKRLN